MSDQARIPVRAGRQVDAPPETVYSAFLDPNVAGRFMFATPDGEMIRAETDPRVGGSYAFVERRGDEEALHVGEYLELDRPRRIVFTFSVDGTEFDRVSIDLESRDGGTEVTLVHEIAARWAEYADQTREGWLSILDGLAETVGGRSA